MSNRDLAKHIAKGIFAVGQWGGEPVERMAYKIGKHKDEREGGGLCEEAMVGVIERLLATAPATGEKS